MEETVIKVPWCFDVSECTQEQWNVIYPYRDLTLGSKISDSALSNYYPNEYIGIDYPNNSHTGHLIGTLYTPSELVRLIQSKDKPKFDNDRWYKTTDTTYPWYVKGKFDNNGLDSFHECINDEKYSNKSTNLGTEGTYKYEELTDLSEIQEFLPDGHVDKVKPKSERYTATMLYFNQLREPERSQAIANYDENYDSQIVGELFTALNSGFSWTSSPEGDYYWQDISDRIEDGSYFKEELLVFGKYKVGDIVVTDKGNIDTVNPSSTEHRMTLFKNGVYTVREFIRPATPEEVEAYNQGVRNIADIKSKNYREAVHCSTQEEFDFVLSKFNPKNINNIYWNEYKEDTCLNVLDLSNPTNEGRYCDKPYYLNRKYNILTFKQWCEKYGHTYESTITIPNEWTANNWYVKVNSQEEANEIIEIAARMYGYDDLIDSYSYINGSWEYVTLRHCNPAYCIQSMEYIKDKKERPISDFIGIVTPTNNIISMVSSNVQYLSTLKPLDLVNTFSGVLSEEDFERLKSPYGKNPLTPSESHLPNLITKSKSNLLDTKVNTIKSISINLQQKPKTIKL